MNKRKVRFAESLRISRSRLNLTQEETAELTNVTRQTVLAWENGTAIPSIDSIAKLSNVLGLTTDNLIFGAKNSIIKESELNELKEMVGVL